MHLLVNDRVQATTLLLASIDAEVRGIPLWISAGTQTLRWPSLAAYSISTRQPIGLFPISDPH
jgi:hypothetical protein